MRKSQVKCLKVNILAAARGWLLLGAMQPFLQALSKFKLFGGFPKLGKITISTVTLSFLAILALSSAGWRARDGFLEFFSGVTTDSYIWKSAVIDSFTYAWVEKTGVTSWLDLLSTTSRCEFETPNGLKLTFYSNTACSTQPHQLAQELEVASHAETRFGFPEGDWIAQSQSSYPYSACSFKNNNLIYAFSSSTDCLLAYQNGLRQQTHASFKFPIPNSPPHNLMVSPTGWEGVLLGRLFPQFAALKTGQDTWWSAKAPPGTSSMLSFLLFFPGIIILTTLFAAIALATATITTLLKVSRALASWARAFNRKALAEGIRHAEANYFEQEIRTADHAQSKRL